MIIFFVLLIIYQILANLKSPIIEGLVVQDKRGTTDDTTNDTTDTTNDTTDTTTNRRNRGDDTTDESADKQKMLMLMIKDMSGNIAKIQKQVNDIAQANADKGTELAGGDEPIDVSGTD
jgi:hypothetical protein